MNADALAQQFIPFFYEQFEHAATRANIVSMYKADACVNYNGRVYNGEVGVEQLFMSNFELGDMTIEPISILAVPACGGVMVGTFCRFEEVTGMKGTFSQCFLLVPDQTGNVTIASDLFSVNIE